jgi:peroxiredoxin
VARLRERERAGVPLSAALALALLAACAPGDPFGPVPRATANAAAAQDFTATDLTGRTLHLGDYLGEQVVLLDFWATYCEPCLAEMPHLEALYEAERGRGFVVLGVAMDGPETEAEVPSYVARNGLSFPVVIDADSHVAGAYNPKKSAPLSVLIDRAGRVVRVREGYNPGDEALVAADVRATLDGKPLE